MDADRARQDLMQAPTVAAYATGEGQPAVLERQLIELGWIGQVLSSGHFFLYGSMTGV